MGKQSFSFNCLKYQISLALYECTAEFCKLLTLLTMQFASRIYWCFLTFKADHLHTSHVYDMLGSTKIKTLKCSAIHMYLHCNNIAATQVLPIDAESLISHGGLFRPSAGASSGGGLHKRKVIEAGMGMGHSVLHDHQTWHSFDWSDIYVHTQPGKPA